MWIDNPLDLIDKYYGPEPRLRAILVRHSMQVADLALEILRKKNLPLDENTVYAAGMLHDIGIFKTHAPSIECHGTEPYIMHGIIGARLLREEKAGDVTADVAERHTGAGITADDIIRQRLPMPVGDYTPRTLLEKLICYADKFYSKSGEMRRKPLDEVRAGLGRFGADTLERFEKLQKMFG